MGGVWNHSWVLFTDANSYVVWFFWGSEICVGRLSCRLAYICPKSSGVVPFECYASVYYYHPVLVYLIFSLEFCNEVVRDFFIPVLIAKVFYHQGKFYVTVFVRPHSLCDSFGCISLGFEVFLQCFILYYPYLYQSINPLFGSDMYIAVNFVVVQVIIVQYLLGDKFDCYFVIFVCLLNFLGRSS